MKIKIKSKDLFTLLQLERTNEEQRKDIYTLQERNGALDRERLTLQNEATMLRSRNRSDNEQVRMLRDQVDDLRNQLEVIRISSLNSERNTRYSGLTDRQIATLIIKQEFPSYNGGQSLKISQIKRLRNVANIGLKDSKDLIEDVYKELGYDAQGIPPAFTGDESISINGVRSPAGGSI